MATDDSNIQKEDVNCLASIVTYNPYLKRLMENIESILALQKSIRIVIIDNASSNLEEIKKIVEEHRNISLISNDSNQGIATALNQAMQFGKEKGADWLLTLDQDSVLPVNLLDEFKKYLDVPQLAVICPVIYDKNVKNFIDFQKTSDNVTEVKECITSGSLNKISAWEDINGFDDFMFIDGVDFDYCFRLKQKNYKIIRANKAVLCHEIGNIKVKRFFGKKFFVQNHNAFRKYFIMRNRVYCDYKHYKKLRTSSFLYFLKSKLLILLYEKNKREKTAAVNKGYKDGKKAGRMLLKEAK